MAGTMACVEGEVVAMLKSEVEQGAVDAFARIWGRSSMSAAATCLGNASFRVNVMK
jgi:hypothetical protein